MSHLHRQLAANAAIAADKDSEHPCTPTVVRAAWPDGLAPPSAGEIKRMRAKARKSAKAKGRRRDKA